MPSPRFQHGFPHDVFISYTHADNQPDRRGPWVERFETDLKARLEVVSGASIDIWWDKKLGAADRFNDAIKDELQKSAVLVVILSPSYFNSAYCQSERESFYSHCASSGQSAVGNKNRVSEGRRSSRPAQTLPADLEEMLEWRFYAPVAGTSRYRELHLHEDAAVRDLYETRVDDVAQEIATILPPWKPAPRPPHAVPSTSPKPPRTCRKSAKRSAATLTQLGYEVTPRSESASCAPRPTSSGSSPRISASRSWRYTPSERCKALCRKERTENPSCRCSSISLLKATAISAA